jgi:hypothetical protein
MTFLSSNPTFGELNECETFVFYDRPLLFTASNAAGHMYLVNWLGEKEGFDEWLLMPISAERLGAAKSGKLSLFELFTLPETGLLWRVAVGQHAELLSSKSVVPEKLSQEDLPIPGATLPPANGRIPAGSEITGNKAFASELKDRSAAIQERKITAELVGVNLTSRTFEVRDILTGDRLKGRIGREIFNQVEKASVPDRYSIVVEEHTSRTPIGQMKTELVLVDATKLGSPSRSLYPFADNVRKN